MAALSPLVSTQYALLAAGSMNKPSEWGAVQRTSVGKYTFTAAGDSGTIQMIRMPAGRLRILGGLSKVVCPVGTATANLSIGHGEYKDINGTVVAADDDEFLDAADVGGGAIDSAFLVSAYADTVADGVEFYTQEGFDITATFDTEDSPASGDLIVRVEYLIGR
jgi:hypothetical protein